MLKIKQPTAVVEQIKILPAFWVLMAGTFIDRRAQA
jgi:hypothetical protein